MADIYNEEIIVSSSDDIEDTSKFTDIARHKYDILRNVYIKLDSLPLSFGIPRYDDEISNEDILRYFRTDLADALRETGVRIEDIKKDTVDEMRLENRIVYYAIKRFRLTASTFFKFSTAVDGKTVDKTQVPKMLQQILNELDAEYKQYVLKNMGKTWTRTSSLNMRID